MNIHPEITVYILCKDYGRYVAECIESIVNQLFENWELIIINDGSKDNSQNVIDKYCKKYPQKIRSVVNECSVGLFKSSNIALRQAKGNYIIRVDADDKLTENCLLSLFVRATKKDNPTVTFGGYYYTNECGKIIGIENIHDETKTVATAFPPHGACTLIKTRSLLKIGGYNEKMTSQDGWDLWFRAYGYQNYAVVAAPMFFYRQHGKSLSRNKGKLLNNRKEIFRNIAESNITANWPTIGIILPVSEIETDNDSITKIIKKVSELNSRRDCHFSVTLVINSVLDKSIFCERYKIIENDFVYMKRAAIDNYHDHRSILKSALSTLKNDTELDIWCYANLHKNDWDLSDFIGCYNYLITSDFDQALTVIEERHPILKNSAEGLVIIGEGKFDDKFSALNQLFRFDGSLIMGWLDSKGIEIFSKKLGYWEVN
jgi:glycosyltransferase involved in cell wall biosynthesis